MARRSGQPEGRVEELTGTPSAPPTPGGDVVEFDPAAPSDTGGEPAVEAAEESAGTIVPEEGIFQARDELESKLGGFQAVASALTQGVSAEEVGHENILGIGVGIKESSGSYTGEVALKVFVREKAPLSHVASQAAVPEEVSGYPTDVEEVGEIFAQTYNRRYPRPVPCGVSCGHVRITAGTIGCLVVLNNNRLCILSNNHVLANQNNAQPRDHIIQPGRVDGGQDPADLIAVLERFVPLHFPGPNLVDCAAAWTSFRFVKPQHVTYRMSSSPLAPSLLLPVMKNGRTTQATQGVITAIAVNGVRVQYSGGVAVFNNQVIIRGIGSNPFSQGGDSGSMIVATRSCNPVALLFAGSVTHTIANPIAAVVSALGISRFVPG